MTRTPAERFGLLDEFMGFGLSPEAVIWFIGLEEAACWSEDSEKDESTYRLYERRYFAFTPGAIDQERKKLREGGDVPRRGYTQVYDVMSKFVVALIAGEEAARRDWPQFRAMGEPSRQICIH